MNKNNIIKWGSLLFRLTGAIIMLQTLYFKFNAAPESVYIFTQLGMEPWGRIGVGIGELIAATLLLIPKTSVLGAILAVQLMAGALFFHFTKLGIEIQNDGGKLFILACLTIFSAVMEIFLHLGNLKILVSRIYR